MCWPILRLVLEGHDYAKILTTWTMGMVLRANRAIDLQDHLNRKAVARARSDSDNKSRGGLIGTR